MPLIKVLFAGAVCLLLPALTAAAAPYREVDAAATKTLMDHGRVLIVNPLSPIEFDHEAIPGSINIPLSQLSHRLPRDRSQAIVFYGLGDRCDYARRAAANAAALGYTNCLAFSGGLPAWKAAGYQTTASFRLPDIDVPRLSPAHLEQMLARDDLLLLDISSDHDTGNQRLDSPKRLQIPLHELKERYTSLPRNKPIVVICQNGEKAPTAVRFLTAKGFTRVLAVDGGILKWQRGSSPTRQP
jgi:rhodanese-related sulfurtransferase